MKIDLHMHTAERSWCCRAFEREQIEAAIKAGLDAIVITDHNLCVSPLHLARLNEIYAPFRVFSGVEMTLVGKDGCNDDVVVIGNIGRDIERWNWSRDWAGLHEYVRSKGGFMMLAHPFRYVDSINIDIERFSVDALELYSNNISDAMRKKIHSLAKRLKITRFFSNSDAHDTGSLGGYFNELDAVVKTNQELADALKSAHLKLHFKGSAQ